MGSVRIQHQVKQVAGLGAGAVATGLDHIVDDASHHRAGPPDGRPEQSGQQRERRPAGVLQHPVHGRDERMRPAPVEGAERVAETRPPDGFQGQPRRVRGDVDPVPGVGGAVPVIQHLPDRLQHDRVVALHGLATERRHENVVRQFPVRVVGLDGEERVTDHLAQRRQVVPHVFAETGFVVHLGNQVESADRNHLGAQQLARRDRAQFFRLGQRGLERGAGVQTQNITQERHPVRRVGQLAGVHDRSAGHHQYVRRCKRGRRGPHTRHGHFRSITYFLTD